MGQGAAFYPGGSGQRMTGGLSTTKFSYDSLKKKPLRLDFERQEEPTGMAPHFSQDRKSVV